MIAVLLLLVAGGVALWYFKFRKPQGKENKKPSYDDFDLDDDDEEAGDDSPGEGDGEAT